MYINIDNIKTKYYDSGEGEAVIFLHGWGSTYTVFESFLNRISAHYRAVSLDMPGFGGSDEPPVGWGVSDYVAFILRFLQQLNIKSAVFIGHSFGGRVIIKLATMENCPVTLSKIILVDSAGIKPKKTLKQKMRLLKYKAVKSIISVELIKKINPELLDNWRKKHGSADYLSATPKMRECFVKVINEDLSGYLPYIKSQTLLLWGENDTDTPISDAKIMEQKIKGSGLVVFKNAGHYCFLDQPYSFEKVLDSFLEIKR